jgi:hypothetical protein
MTHGEKTAARLVTTNAYKDSAFGLWLDGDFMGAGDRYDIDARATLMRYTIAREIDAAMKQARAAERGRIYRKTGIKQGRPRSDAFYKKEATHA